MYDLPALRRANAALWRGLAARLRAAGFAAPGRLSRPRDLAAHWRDPALLLSQSCGYPLLSLPARVRVVATPCYDAPGCADGWYRSALVVPRDSRAATLLDLRGAVCALNQPDSNSGMNLLRAAIAPLAGGRRFFREIVTTGSHAASLAAVGAGRADLASIDAVTLQLLRLHRPGLVARVRLLGWSAASPGLPLISAGDAATVAALRTALSSLQADPAMRPVLRTLLIDRFVTLPMNAYRAIGALEAEAAATGYPELR